jgi:hypothetical protein
MGARPSFNKGKNLLHVISILVTRIARRSGLSWPFGFSAMVLRCAIDLEEPARIYYLTVG